VNRNQCRKRLFRDGPGDIGEETGAMDASVDDILAVFDFSVSRVGVIGQGQGTPEWEAGEQ
jgi:hypothetical protein